MIVLTSIVRFISIGQAFKTTQGKDMRPIIDQLESAQDKIDSAIIHLAGIESDDAAIAMAMLKKAGERLALEIGRASCRERV